jgi:dihydroorotate dehydrogenase
MIPTVDMSFWHRLGPLTRAVQSYGRAQRKRPWVTQLCTSLTIYFCADLAAQRIGGKGYDPERTFRSVTIGGIASIPSYEWYVWRHPGPAGHHSHQVVVKLTSHPC